MNSLFRSASAPVSTSRRRACSGRLARYQLVRACACVATRRAPAAAHRHAANQLIAVGRLAAAAPPASPAAAARRSRITSHRIALTNQNNYLAAVRITYHFYINYCSFLISPHHLSNRLPTIKKISRLTSSERKKFSVELACVFVE